MQRQCIFTYRGHPIRIDARKVARWREVSDFEKLKIWRSARTVYTTWLNQWDAAASKPTREGIRIHTH